MKSLSYSIRSMIVTVISALALAGMMTPASVSAQDCPALLNHKFNRLQDDSPQNLCQYAGKVTLVVNTASYCGYTSQYEGLEKLYATYKDKGLVILGFPSNDFSQEPGGKSPGWNFSKYLIDRDGKLVGNFGSSTRPDEKAFVSTLEKALASQ